MLSACKLPAWCGAAHGSPHPSHIPTAHLSDPRSIARVQVTADLRAYLPSFLPPLLFGKPLPLERLAVDDERGVLYACAGGTALQVRPLS